MYSEYEKNDESIVFSGESGMSYTNAGVVMHVKIADDKYAEVHMFSPFQSDDNDVIIFEENGQQFEYVLINGVRQNFRQYLLDQQIDRSKDAGVSSQKCLAGDFAGLIMNVAIVQENEIDAGKYVTVGTPVYKNIPYRLASMVNMSYENQKINLEGEIICSFTCITNYSYPEVFTKYFTHMNGPCVYGEIAYFMLGQATVFLTVGNLSN